MHNVGDISGSDTPSSKSKISIVTSWELVAVNPKEHAPDEVPGIAGKEPEDGVERDSYIEVRIRSVR